MPVPEQMVQQPSPFAFSVAFRGVNLQIPAERLPITDYQLADNLWVIGGELWLRPGFRAMFALALPDPIFSLRAYAVSDSLGRITTWLAFVSAGKLYVAMAGRSEPPTEIKIGGPAGTSFALDSPNVQMQRVGQWLYIVDGDASKPLYKVQIPNTNPLLEYKAEEYSGMVAPTDGFKASLTNGVLDAADDPTVWSSFPALSSTLEIINNPSFHGGSTHDTDPPPFGWMTGGDSMDFKTKDGADNYAYFDSGLGPTYVDRDAPSPTYAATVHSYTDLVLVAGQGGLVVSSAAHRFFASDDGSILKVRSGAGFTPGPYKVLSVDGSGNATLNVSAGVAGSVGGVGVLVANSGNTIRNARVFVAKAENAIAVPNRPGQYSIGIIPEDSSVLGSVAAIDVTDLQITAVGGSTTTVQSVQYSFVAGDATKSIEVTGADPAQLANWTLGGYVILSVNTGVTPHTATLQGIAGVMGATLGAATLGYDAETTAWGASNFTLLNPPSQITGASVAKTVKVQSSAWTEDTEVLSLTGLVRDFDYLRLRIRGEASNGNIGVTQVSLLPVDVRLIPTKATNGALHLAANDPLGFGGNCLGGCWVKRDYTGTPVDRSDLVIGVDPTKIASPGTPFGSADVGKSLILRGGVGVTVSAPQILAVDGAGVATLSAAAGVSGSTGGYGRIVSTQDFSQSGTISARYSAPATSGQIPFAFGFLQPGQPLSAITWSNEVTYTADGSAFFCDVSTITADILGQVAYLFLGIVSDLPDTIQVADLCTIGPISTSGNLTLNVQFGGWGGDYNYQATELDAANDSVNFIDVVESDPGPVSTPPMQPNGVSNQVTGALPAAVNPQTTHQVIYRTGGVFDDGLGRLIAIVDLASDTVSQSLGPVTWDHTTRRFTDNTSDAALEINIPTFLLSGRTPPPNGASCNTEWQGHIGIGIGSILQLSWLIPAGSNTGLYFNTVNVPDPNDIAQAVKGGLWDTGQDNDPVMQLVPIGPYLITLKQRSLFMLTGVDASSFTLLPHLIRAGTGLIARNAWAVLGHVLWFLGPDGVYQYNAGDDLSSMSRDIEPVLNPSSRALPKLDPQAYGASFMVYHGQRLYLCVPGSAADNVPTVVWVWDTRTQGWVGRWNSFAWGAGMEFTSAASLAQESDGDDLYWACRDGQIYHMTGFGDTQAGAAGGSGQFCAGLGAGLLLSQNLGVQPSAGGQLCAGLGGFLPLGNTGVPIQAVPFKFVSRAFGQEQQDGNFWNLKTVDKVRVYLQSEEDAEVTLSVNAAACPVTWANTYRINQTSTLTYIIPDSQVVGANAWVTVSGKASTPFRIKAVALVMAEGSPGES